MITWSNGRVPQKVKIFQAQMNCFVKMELSSDEICELLITKKKEQSSVYNASRIKNVQAKKSNIKRQTLCKIHKKNSPRQVIYQMGIIFKAVLYVWQNEIKAPLPFNCCCDETPQFILVKIDQIHFEYLAFFQKFGVMDSSKKSNPDTLVRLHNSQCHQIAVLFTLHNFLWFNVESCSRSTLHSTSPLTSHT